jgi:hypothetical protein
MRLSRRHLDAAVEAYKVAGGDPRELDVTAPFLQAAYNRIGAASFQPSPGAQHQRDIPPAIWPKNTPPPAAWGPGRP